MLCIIFLYYVLHAWSINFYNTIQYNKLTVTIGENRQNNAIRTKRQKEIEKEKKRVIKERQKTDRQTDGRTGI